MKQRKARKILLIIVIIFFIVCCLTSTVLADGYDTSGWTNDVSGGADTAVETVMGIGINVVRIVGIGISIIMLSYVAIKYMMAAPDERASFKKSAMLLVLGAALVFASTNILTRISDIAGSLF